MSAQCPMYDAECFLSILPISTTDTAFTSLAIDTIGAHWVTIIFMAGAIGAADFGAALTLEECETSGGSYASVGSSSSMTAPTQTSDGGMWCWHVDCRKRMRFLKVVADPGNAATLGAAIAIKHRKDKTPTSATERGFTAEAFVV